jgi:hypothetical protein
MSDFTDSSTTVVSTFVHTSGSNASSSISSFNLVSSNITTFCLAEASSDINGFTGWIQNGTSAFVSDGGNINMQSMRVENADVVFSVGENSTIKTLGCHCNNCTVDMQTLTSSSTFEGVANIIQEDKISLHPSSTVRMTNLSDKLNDEGYEIKGELHVGTPEFPSESVFGEGDSYTREMLVYTYHAGTSAYTDVSTSAQSFSGSTFEFPSLSAGDAIYIASGLQYQDDYVKHFGIKLNLETSGNALSATVVECWDGSSWNPITFMITEGESPFYALGSALDFDFTSVHVRYNNNIALSTDPWTKNDPVGLGSDRYWMRWRLFSDITESPRIQQIKLHSNRSEFNLDGWLEFFGKARPIAKFPWDGGVLVSANNPPGNQNVFLGDNLGVGRIYNRYMNGVIDRAGFLLPLPLDCDTSTPIDLKWSCTTSGGTSADTIDWVIRWSYSTEGDSVYWGTTGAPTSAINQQETYLTCASPDDQTEKWYETQINISGMVARRESGNPDTLWLTLQRSGDTDAFDGHIVLISLNGYYTQWCVGGHI